MPYLSYQVNYKYISTVLCKNKTRPVLQCHGKCHLQKELKKTAGEKTGNNSGITIQLELEDMPVQAFELSVTRVPFIFTSSYKSLEENIISSAREKTFPPPRVS